MYPLHLKIAIYGSSGSGKSTLIELLRKISKNVTVHRKDTTRPPRPVEMAEGCADLRFVSAEEFEKNRADYDIVYTKYGFLYGIRRDQLVSAFEKKEIHVVIIRDITALQQFKYMYPDAIAVYVHADPKMIPANLQKREGVDFSERLRRVEMEYKEFIENSTLFDNIIVNFWEIDNAVRQIQNILHLHVRKAASNLR